MIASSFENIFLVSGDGNDRYVLHLLGLKTCKCIHIVPKPRPKPKDQDTDDVDDPFLVDSDAIFTARYILKELKSALDQGDRDEDLPVPSLQVELTYESNLKFIEPPHRLISTSSFCQTCLRCGPCIHFVDKFLPEHRLPPPIHPLVCSGSVSFSGTFTKVMTNMWKSDGRLLHLMRLLVLHGDTPSQIQSSAVLRCVPCPEYAQNKTFSDVFKSFCLTEHPVILIGLYREAVDESSRSFRFVYTNPPPSSLLHPSDYLFVLVNSKHSYLRDNLP